MDYIEEDGRKFVLVEVAGKVYRIPRQDILKANLADAGKRSFTGINAGRLKFYYISAKKREEFVNVVART